MMLTRQEAWASFLLAACVALLPGCAGETRRAGIPIPRPSTAPVPLPEPETFTLSSGLQVWLLHSDHVPTVALSLIVRSGSSSDPVGKEGHGSSRVAVVELGVAGGSNRRSPEYFSSLSYGVRVAALRYLLAKVPFRL